jgi:hypothetical protein
MSDVAEVVDDELEQHTLTYHGPANPKTGTLMGTGMDGRIWKVLGAVYNPVEDTTGVILEEFPRE